MAKIKKYQAGGKAKPDSVESEMFPGKKIPRSQSNYENGSFARMLEAGKPKAAKPKPAPKKAAVAPKKKLKGGGKLAKQAAIAISMKKKGIKPKMEKAKGGKEMIKRADGSVSQRGLWDNIRAAAKRNKAAGKPGKKPTAAMLKQERKIKAKGK
jgi:hypothetical protein